jgi:hypothetical protein
MILRVPPLVCVVIPPSAYAAVSEILKTAASNNAIITYGLLLAIAVSWLVD